jgi:hypothetical protein
MSFGNVPPDALGGALEKLLAKMDDNDLAILYERELAVMPPDAFHAFVEAMFSVFRERGESSEDAAEGAGVTLENIARRERGASEALIRYARANPDLLKESTALFVQRRPDFVAVLPATLREALAERLTVSS